MLALVLPALVEMNTQVTVLLLVILAAAVCVVMEAMGRFPPWISKVLIIVALLLLVLPAK